MTTDYEPFLRVTDDGHIWWLREDAIRLGAGYLPVRDDQDLKTELRAPNQRALVNERTLIGAFGSDRYSIERPIAFERDGFRYVDAGKFLSWLSQYISQTQAKIAFPNELVQMVREAMAKATASLPPVVSQEFESLTLALDGWFEKNLDDIPKALRQRVERDFFLLPWDGLSADQRLSKALQWDYFHDPAKEQERQDVRNLFARRYELQKQKDQWESVSTPTASDLAEKESRLKEIQEKLDCIDLQIRQRRGDYYPGRECLDVDKGEVAPTSNLTTSSEKGGRPKSPLTEAVEEAYLHFRDKGDVAILKPGNIRSFLKSFKSLIKDDDQSQGIGNGNICAYIAERIKEVKIPRAGDCVVVTQDRVEGQKIAIGQSYSQRILAKLLAKLRKKYPLTS